MNDLEKDDLFGDLAATWREETAPEIDDPELRVQRSLARMRLMSLLEIAVAVMGTAFGCWAVWQGELVIGCAAMVFAGTSLLLVLDDRRRDRRGLIEPVAIQLVGLYGLERRRYRRGWYGLFVSLLAEGFLMVVVLADPGMLDRPDGQLTLVGTTVFVIVGLIYSVRQILVGRLACERIQKLSGLI